jgi:hypothetical protein
MGVFLDLFSGGFGQNAMFEGGGEEGWPREETEIEEDTLCERKEKRGKSRRSDVLRWRFFFKSTIYHIFLTERLTFAC